MKTYSNDSDVAWNRCTRIELKPLHFSKFPCTLCMLPMHYVQGMSTVETAMPAPSRKYTNRTINNK